MVPGLVTNESAFDGSHSMCQADTPGRRLARGLSSQHLERSLAVPIVEPNIKAARRLARNEIRRPALAMSIEVNSRFEASYGALPWSKGAAISAPINVTRADGLSARFGIGDVPACRSRQAFH